MKEKVKGLVKEYYQWLFNKVDVLELEESEWVITGTPFENFMGDLIDLYIKISGNEIIISDGGETLSNLEFVGVNINKSKRRKQIFENIIMTYGILTDGKSLFVKATEKDFVKKKHQLIQAILQISDMFLLTKENVASIFKEDVKNFLEEEDIPFTEDILLRGKSGLEFNIDFLVFSKNTEKIIKATNNPNKNTIATFLFAWEDVKEIREKKKALDAIMIFNDTNKKIPEEYLTALEQKNAYYILWSERYEPKNLELLAA